MADDSPLSIAANITGILTFAVAVVLGIYARMISLQHEATRVPKMLEDIAGTAVAIRMHLDEVAMLEKMSDRTDGQSLELLALLYWRLLTAASPLAMIARKSLLQKRLSWDETRAQVKIDLLEFERLKRLLMHKQSISLQRQIDCISKTQIRLAETIQASVSSLQTPGQVASRLDIPVHDAEMPSPDSSIESLDIAAGNRTFKEALKNLRESEAEYGRERGAPLSHVRSVEDFDGALENILRRLEDQKIRSFGVMKLTRRFFGLYDDNGQGLLQMWKLRC